jgi:methylated-DNA-protein-cysteine methyltransferase related protein
MSDPYERIYQLVRQIPPGKVTTYGQLGAMCGIADPRVVGEAMNASHDVPWQRVINSRGEISIKGASGAHQRELLEAEGVEFDEGGRVDLVIYGWVPDAQWLQANGYAIPPALVKEKKARSYKGADTDSQPSLF